MQIKITGIEETLELLDSAPKNIVMLSYARAARAAMNVVAGELAANTPILAPELARRKGRKSRGALARALKVDVQADAGARGVAAYVGFPGEQATVANALEYGHDMVDHNGRTIGWVPAHPFMRIVFDASGEAAVDAFAESLGETLKANY